MENFDTPRLIYLVILGAAIAGYFIAENRQSMSKNMQQAAIWALIFLGTIAGYGLWNDIKGTVNPSQTVFDAEGRIELPRERDGHFYLEAELNGTKVNFVIDTGATDVVLTRRDARRIGIEDTDLNFSMVARTANGEVRTAAIQLNEIRIGEIVDHGIWVMVNGGELDISLLGMAYLERFARIEIVGNKLILTR